MAIIRNIPTERVVNGKVVYSSESAIVTESTFTTKGEGILIIKGVDNCTLSLDHVTTDHVTIKALTNVLIIPMMGKIDDSFDELSISNGACVEMTYIAGGWYILSSDGLKQS